MINLLHADCMEFMKTVPDKYYDLAIVDPPYGISINENMGIKKGQKKRHTKKVTWDDKIPTDKYFDEVLRVSENIIVWGGNYFGRIWANGCRHFIFWDKKTPEGMSFSDGELAFTSFNRADRRVILYNDKGGKIHPTQKPVALYEWLLKNYAKPGQKIIDTHGGSFSHAIAVHNMNTKDHMNLSLDIMEIDEEYYQKGVERYQKHIQQLTIFQ